MALESVACNNCGAPLQVPEEANFVTCVHCDTQLSVKRTGNARFTEAIEDLKEQVERLSRQNELAALDRNWDREKESFMISGEHGHRQLPTKAGSLFGGIAITGFGLFWTVFAGRMGGAPFALFGVLFVVVGIAMSIYSYRKADDYEDAHRRYQRRRRKIRNKPDAE